MNHPIKSLDDDILPDQAFTVVAAYQAHPDRVVQGQSNEAVEQQGVLGCCMNRRSDSI
ncbi:MAG: hypothetical protein HHJ16_13315 [Polaromonas sp.]|uniref:hypothetical protein n=1 Tax=Polaromonas sp. TaxID=1869339 RepID=UPI0017FDE647|nr:hypothetical protein [Polaromonas sp.]NMM11236.1 hypothetical protein [Polaromonas sp.]